MLAGCTSFYVVLILWMEQSTSTCFYEIADFCCTIYDSGLVITNCTSSYPSSLRSKTRRYYWTPRACPSGTLAELRSFNGAGGNMTDSSALAAPCQTPFLLPHITDLPQCTPDPPLLALGKSHVSHVRRESGVVIAKLRSAHGVPVAG